MDIQMPGMDGIEALQWFRRGASGRFPFMTPPRTPVVAVTANALDGGRAAFPRPRLRRLPSKPFAKASCSPC